MLRPSLRHVVLSVPIALLIAPAAAQAAEPVEIGLLGSTPAGGEAAAEIAAFDPVTDRAYVTNSATNRLDIFSLVDPAVPVAADSIDLAPFGAGPNSVAYSPAEGGIVAVAVEDTEVGVDGSVQVFDTDGEHLSSFRAGPLPDMITFTEDGTTMLVANEGEPADDGSVDPEGSVTIIDIAEGLGDATVKRARFDGVPLRGPVRTYAPGSSIEQDLEPEYITTAGDEAWVSIQEANAIGVLDIPSAEFETVRSLGFKDYGASGNALDATDEDGAPNIEQRPNVFGMYQPDALSAFTVPVTTTLTDAEYDKAVAEAVAAAVPVAVAGALASKETQQLVREAERSAGSRVKRQAKREGWSKARTKRELEQAKTKAERRVRTAVRAEATELATAEATASVERETTVQETYIATANEGDSRDFSFFAEEERAGDLPLDPAAFPAGSEDDLELGRLNVTTTLGDSDRDGLYEGLYTLGGRSMSLIDTSARIVYDTGDDLEQLNASLDPDNFNTNNEAGSDIDDRSDNKGPEPESVATGLVGDSTYAFVGAERSGMIYAFDLSATPGEAAFAGWINTREGDLGPEGMELIEADESPTGEAMLLVTYEISGTVTAYGVTPAP